MDTLTAIHRRRTTQAWQDTQLDADVIDQLLSAAHQAPCHKLTWPWRFVVVGPETREQLIPVGAALAAAKANIPVGPKIEAKVRCKVAHPGALIAVALKRCDDAFRAREDYAATACAVQNLMLAATALGLGSKWGTGGLTRHPDTAAILGIDTATEEVVGFVFVGTPARTPRIERPPVDEFVTRLP